MNQSSLPDPVRCMRDISITGNVVPMAWFKTITFDNGKPDTNAILILSDIVYWYRPTEVRDERTGSVIGYRKKFSEDLLRRSYSDLEAQFGFSKRQCQLVFERLESMGVVKRILRRIDSVNGPINNVMYIDLNVDVLKTLTFPSHIFSDHHTPSNIDVTTWSHGCNEVVTPMSYPNDIDVTRESHGCNNHIKDTNTTPEITLSPESSQESSSPSSESDEGEIALQMISIWNEVLPQKSVSSLSGFLKDQLESAYHLHLDASLTQWQLVCEHFKSSKFLMGEAEGVRIKPDLAWLLDLRKDHLHNVLNKAKYTFDDRVANNKVKTVKDIEADIEASNDNLELKSLKRDALQISPMCYLGYFRHSRFEMTDTKLTVFVPTSYAKEQIEERSYDAISNLVRTKYNRSFEVCVERKQ